MSKSSAILDSYGRPFTKTNGHARKELVDFFARTLPNWRGVDARYDAAVDSDEYKNYWANADTLDADSANSRAVREKLVPRARYEAANNGFVDGMLQTHANYLIGVGPSLRMQTGNTGFNNVVELVWFQWQKAILFRRKLWCMCHAKVQDGEAFGILVNNPGLPTRIKLDLKLIETEQVQTPMPPMELGYTDGIKFDEFDNPEWYDVLPFHPGAAHTWEAALMEVVRVPAAAMLHWFHLRRPGQHRGVPEFRSTLNVGAASRRMREATVSAVEVAASLGAVMLHSTFPPDDEAEAPDPLSTLNIQRKMMTTLPQGWDAKQMSAEHPNAQYDTFLRQQLNETARPKSIPYNLAACDSSSYNYASGRLDHQTYFSELDVERQDGDDLVLDKTFAAFWPEAVREYGWNVPSMRPPAHTWDWPKHPVADQKSDAMANDVNLHNGTTTITRVYFDKGLDPEDEAATEAAFFGKTVEEVKEAKFKAIYQGKSAGPLPDDDENGEPIDEDAADLEALKARMDTYGIGVRAGSLTPQIEDEDFFRSQAGLPPLSDAARAAWAKDKGVRRPITLVQEGAPKPTPFGGGGTPNEDGEQVESNE